MAVFANDEQEYIDNAARAQRVTNVDASGNPTTGATRTTALQRVNTATTTNIAAGLRSYSITVLAASSASSPTIGGAAAPAGYTVSFTADGSNTLTGMAVVTATGDDVLIATVS